MFLHAEEFASYILKTKLFLNWFDYFRYFLVIVIDTGYVEIIIKYLGYFALKIF